MTVNSQNWAQSCETVTKAMADFTRPYITPISSPDKYVNSRGTHKGTGNFVNLFGKRLLITNEHVIKKNEDHGNAIMFHGNDTYFRPTRTFPAIEFPYDTAIGHISDDTWNNTFPSHQAKAIPESKILSSHADNLEEIFFVQGFPGQLSMQLTGLLNTQSASISTQQLSYSSQQISTDSHFAIHFAPHKLDESVRNLDDPEGMSGSLVWNTRFFECQSLGKTWSPDEAVVTGLAYSFDEDSKIYCIKIERVREAVAKGIEVLGLQ